MSEKFWSGMKIHEQTKNKRQKQQPNKRITLLMCLSPAQLFLSTVVQFYQVLWCGFMIQYVILN